MMEEPTDVVESIPAVAPSRSGKLGWIVAGALLIIAASTSFFAYKTSHSTELKAMVRLDADVGSEISLGSGEGSTLAVAPDGSRLTFVTPSSGGKERLALRLLDGSQTVVLQDTEGAANPFFSPDSRWIAFFADGKLKKISVEGGKAINLCNARNPRGGSWGEDGNILFAPENRAALLRVSASGGDPQPATQLDSKAGEVTNRYPQVLPRSEAFLFQSRTAERSNEDATIQVQSMKTGERKTLIKGAYYAHYVPSGHLIYMRQDSLYAAPMDAKRLELTRPGIPGIEDLRSGGRPGFSGNGYAFFDFTQSGTLVYVPAARTAEQSVSWVDDTDTLTPIPLPPGRYVAVNVSPDGSRLALLAEDGGGTALSIYDVLQQRLSRIASFSGTIIGVGWAPDGKHIAFTTRANQLSGPGIYWMRADGAGEPLRLVDGSQWFFVSISGDGKRLGYWSRVPPYGLWTLPLDLTDPDRPKAGKPELLLHSNVEVRGPTFSPDGRWVGYSSFESGRLEAYVRSFSERGGKWRVSTDGGGWPIWSQRGGHLYYPGLDHRIYVVDYTATQKSFDAIRPRLWTEKARLIGDTAFGLEDLPNWQRLAFLLPTTQGDSRPPTHAVFLLNFFDELRRKVPLK